MNVLQIQAGPAFILLAGPDSHTWRVRHFGAGSPFQPHLRTLTPPRLPVKEGESN